MLLATERKATFERDGYVVLDRLFSNERMAAAKAEVRDVLDRVRNKAKEDGKAPPRDNGVFVGLALNSPFFRALNAEPALVDVLEDIIGPDLEFWSDKVVFKSSDVDFGSPWHQDWSYWHGAHKYSVWIAVDDATPENGCLRVLPGSHKSVVEHGGQDSEGIGFGNRLRQDQVDESKAVDLPAPAGTAVVFHDLLLHASYANKSGRDRWALIPTCRDISQDDLEYEFAKAAFVLRGSRKGKILPKPER